MERIRIEPIQWSSDYETGIEALDHQHRGLVRLLNQAAEVMSSGGDRPHLLRIMDDLSKASIAHFRAEEEVMQRCGYPDWEYHKRLHQTAVREAMRIMVGFSKTQDINRATQHLGALTKLFLDHFLSEDRSFGNYLKSSS